MPFAEPIRSSNDSGIGIANNGGAEPSPTPTFGEVLPDLNFEVVTDPGKPETLQLHAREGSRFFTSSRIERDGKAFVPAKIEEGLALAVRFPSSSTHFGTPASLTASGKALRSGTRPRRA